jgi:hypothetical protein
MVHVKYASCNAQFPTNYCYNFVALVRKRTIQTERPPFVGEVSAVNLGFSRPGAAIFPFKQLLSYSHEAE